MGRTQITITIDEQALADVDRLIRNGVYADRSQAIESAVKERIEKLGRTRLARECALLDKTEEQRLADEALNEIIA